MMRDAEKPTINEHGYETHPAFGVARFNHVRGGGTWLFDSDVRHDHRIYLEIDTAVRKRELNSDWIHPSDTIIQVEMSYSQFGALVSSFGSGSGVPVTITERQGQGPVPHIIPESRFEKSLKEVRDAAETQSAKAQADLEELLAALNPEDGRPKMKNVREAARNLEASIRSLPSNLVFASEKMHEHAENVVNKAKADIEAMVDDRVRQYGLDRAALDLPEQQGIAALGNPDDA